MIGPNKFLTQGTLLCLSFYSPSNVHGFSLFELNSKNCLSFNRPLFMICSIFLGLLMVSIFKEFIC